MQFHTGIFNCCQCCPGMYAVHCCGECCKGTELGWGVQARLECSHPCVKGAMRHDGTAVKKRAQSKGRGTQELEDWDGMPKGGVGRWSCCGGGCLTLSCNIRSSVSQPRDEMIATPSPSPPNQHHSTPRHGNRSPMTPSLSPSPNVTNSVRAQSVPTHVVDMSLVGLPDTYSNPSTTPQPSHRTLPVASPSPSISGSSLSIYFCEECCTEPGAVWCCNCEALYCRADFESAHSTKIGRRHCSVAVSYQPSKCLEHPDQYAILFCLDCKKDICRMCCCGPLQGRHTSHEVVNLGAAEDSARELISDKIKVIRSAYQGLSEKHTEAVRKKQDIRGTIESAKQDVNRFFSSAASAALRAIEKRKTELLTEIDRLTVPTVASVMTREVALSRGIKSCQETCVAVDAALSTNKVLQLQETLLAAIDSSLAAIQPLSTTDDTVGGVLTQLDTHGVDLSSMLVQTIQSHGEISCVGIANTLPLESRQSESRTALQESENIERSALKQALTSFNDLAASVPSPPPPPVTVATTPPAAVVVEEKPAEPVEKPTKSVQKPVESIQKDTTINDEQDDQQLTWCELCELETTPERCEYCDSLCIKKPEGVE
eukprot:TRINITY_DN21565_c0_g1_i1.p1 TRINITY_DN21565_c0_g1~~TRINITY_DN21565_c0_g1_i1.p1  ORF type:complete len:622 (+),score=109.16 TRINITY_DN21565_c0_g1_i1:71-1867(+)